MKPLNPLIISGREVLPLVEGGKGISVSNGESSGAWAATGGVGTFSGVNADSYGEWGELIPQIYHGRTRRERHEELVAYAIAGGIEQARVAHERGNGQGRIHMNVLWEMAAAERVLHGVLEGAKGLIHGVTCGAGMPYKIAEICAHYNVHYYPIVSSARAFRALWKRAYHKFCDWLGGVVYEDPWLAGGHNGLSNSEDPLQSRAALPAGARAAQPDGRVRARRDPDLYGGRAVVSARVDRLDRQPRARAGRVSVRNPPAGDPGKPDLAGVEAQAADPGRGRRLSQSLQPDRILLVGGAQRLSRRAAGALGAPGRLCRRAGRRTCRRRFASARATVSSI